MNKNKTKTFMCRLGIHRWVAEVWFKEHGLYLAGCKVCHHMNENLLIRVNDKLTGRDHNLHLSFSKLEK